MASEMKDVIIDLHAKGVYPSMVKISGSLSYKGLFLDKKFWLLRKQKCLKN